MRKRACVAATGLMAGRASGLSEASRLKLEHHLETCPACATDELDLHRLIAGTGATDMPLLGERARSRAIAGALSAGSLPRATAPASSSWLRWAAPATALAAAAIAMLWVLGSNPEPRPETTVHGAGRLVAGELDSPAGALEVGAALEADRPLSTRAGARLQVGHAMVSLAADTTVSWSPASSTLTLSDGSVRASVDPAPHKSFRVATDEFAVEVLGTEFEVTADGVTVYEGHVRVVASDGEVLLADLGAGEAWQVPEEIARRPRRPRTRRPRPHVAAPDAPDAHDATELIDRARTHLAGRDVAEARKALDEALGIATTATQNAEARTLLAECALVEGNHAEAVDRYLRVAERYHKMRAGETALFAAARIEARHGSAARARKLLERYLEQYANGRFVEEALRRLDELE